MALPSFLGRGRHQLTHHPNLVLRIRTQRVGWCTLWDSAARWRVRRWPTRTSRVIGGSLLISRAGIECIAWPLYVHDQIGVDRDQSLYALDSTTIDLCLSIFPWAKFRQRKAAVKMHTLLDLHNIPTFVPSGETICNRSYFCS